VDRWPRSLCSFADYPYTYSDRGLRALRNAKQGNLSNTFGIRKSKAKVIAMVKQMFSWARRLAPAALVWAGWSTFIGGICSQVLWLRIVLLSVARVLPTALILKTLECHY